MIERNLWLKPKSTCESYSIIEDMDGNAFYAGHRRAGAIKNLVQRGKDERIYVVAYRSVRLADKTPAWEFEGISVP